MMDLLYLAHNRLEYTRASLENLIENTAWSEVSRLFIYDDNSGDGTTEYLRKAEYPFDPLFQFDRYGGPVAVMKDYLEKYAKPGGIFGKIDSDTMVPAGWLEACLAVMDRHPELDLLGIEVFNTVVCGDVERNYTPASHIGGIGLMRARAFKTLPKPNGRFGFTGWQVDEAPDVVKGWIDPSLPVFLLDHLPREPWKGLARDYVRRGWARRWGLYDEGMKDMWSWWCE